MKSKNIVLILVTFLSLISVLFFQNCSGTRFKAVDTESATVRTPSSVSTQPVLVVTPSLPLDCGARTNNQVWMESTNQTRQQAVFCEYGGNRFEILRTEIEKICQNAVISNTGNSREVSEGFTGACNEKPQPPTVKIPDCGTHLNASTWQENDTENSIRACPSSAVQITDVFNRVTTYRCDAGVVTTVSRVRTTLQNTIGSCPALNCSAQFASAVVLKNAPASLSWTCVNASSAKYDCSNGQQNAAAALAGSSQVSTAKSGVISCAVTGTNSLAATHQAVATLTIRECNPGTTTTDGCATLANGSGSRTCAGDGMSYGSCDYSCEAGYILSGAASGSPTCLPVPSCPTGRVQCGSKGFNAAGTIYSIDCGEDGYDYQRDSVNGNWNYLGNGMIQLKTDATIAGDSCCMNKDGSGLGCSTQSVNVER